MKKNYVKLIGLFAMVLCTVLAIEFVTVRTKASDKVIQYISDGYTTEDGIPTLDGYLFAGWYVEDNVNGGEDGYSPVINKEENKTYYAKFVPEEVLDIRAQVSQNIIDNDGISDKANNSIRFVTAIDSTEYRHVGFEIQKGSGTAEIVETTNKIYKEIYAVSATAGAEPLEYKAEEEFHSTANYFKTFTITNVPEDAFNTDITVRPYWDTLDGTRIFGTTAIKTVNLGRSWFYVDSAATNANALGTYNDPHSTIDKAIAHETEYEPKIILKSDYELTGQLKPSKSLTLASVGEKTVKRKTAWGKTDGILNIQSGVAITLEDVIIDGGSPDEAQSIKGIRVEKGATLNVNSGAIVQNVYSSHGNGGGVTVLGTLNLKGGTITNNKAKKGGNVYLDTSGVMTMTSGTISGGIAWESEGGNICNMSTNANSITISGGTITGGQAVNNGGNLHTRGNVSITGGTISDGVVQATAALGNAVGVGGNIYAIRPSETSTIELNIIKGSVTGGSAKATSDGASVNGRGGNIYLNGGVKFVLGEANTSVAEQAVVSGGIDAVDGANIFARNVNSITIEDGGVVKEGTATNGGNLHVAGSSLNIYGGVVKEGTASNYGGSIYIVSGAKLNMTGGTITGGNAGIQGGNIYTQGDITMSGGTISSGIAKYSEAPTFQYGVGGNIFASGVDSTNTANVTITGGEVTGGYANGRGGNVYLFDNANLTLGKEDATEADLAIISNNGKDGNNLVPTGGNIFVRGACSVTIKAGGTVTGGTAKAQGGNINFASSGTLTIDSGTITRGSAATLGGNIYNSGSMFVKGTASINYGTATSGGNIYNEGTVNVEATTVDADITEEELKAVLSGKNISVLGDSISTFTDISNGKSADTTNSTIENNNNWYTTEYLPSWKETYWGRMVDKYNMNLLVNNSASGAYILTDRSANQLSGISRCTELHDDTGNNAGTEPDIIAVYMGTNDLINATTLGELTEATYSAVKTQNGEYITPTTFTEGYIILLDKMMNRYQNADVFCFTLLPCSSSSSNETLLNDYNVRIREIAKHYGASVVDIASESGITLNNYTWIQNGSHPLVGGMSWVADVFEEALGKKYDVEVPQHTANISRGAAVEGGNIYTLKTLNIERGTVADGTAETSGGNIYVAATTMIMNDGSISQGVAKGGGNIYLAAGGNYIMNGGTISDGTAGSNSGGNIFADGATATLTVNAGSILNGLSLGAGTRIGGNIQLNHSSLILGEGKITITGGARISDNKEFPLCIYGGATNKITLPETMHAESQIDIWVSSAGVFANNATESLEKYQTIFIPVSWANKTISIDTSAQQLKW